MAAKYLIATGNWSSDLIWSTTDGGANDTTHPVDGDAVSCTAASGAVTLTVDVSSAATSIVFTGFTGTFTGSAALQLKGNLTAVAGMTYSYTGTITEALTAGTATLTSAGKTLCGALTMNGSGGTLTFGDAFVTTGGITHTGGTLSLANNVNITSASYSSTGSGVRALTQGTNAATTWFITGSGAVWTVSGSNYTHNGNALNASSTTDFNYSGSSSRTISTAFPFLFTHVKISAGSGAFDYTVSGTENTGRVQSLDCTGYTGALTITGTYMPGDGPSTVGLIVGNGNVTLGAGMTLLAAGGQSLGLWNYDSSSCTVTTNGVSLPGGLVVYNAVTVGSDLAMAGLLNLSEAELTFNASNYNITCDTFNSSTTLTRTITMGSGTWTLTSTAATTVWDTSVTTGLTLNANTATIALTGVTASTRTISANSVQLPSIAVNAGSGAVTFTNVNCDSLTFGNSYSGTIANQTITIRGNVQLSNHLDFALTAGANAWTLAATATGKTFTSQGKTVDFPLTFNGVGGGWTFADALTHGITRTLTLTNGALSFGTGLTHTMGFLASSNANTRTIDTGTSTLQFPATGVLVDTSTSTNLTWTGAGTLKLTDSSATARSITAGTKRLPSIWVSAGTSTTTLTDVTGCIDLLMTGMGAGTIAAGSAAFAIGGSVAFVAAGTWSYTGALTFDATATGKTITSAGKALTSSTVTFNGAGGGWILQDAPGSTGAWSALQGDLDLNGYDFAIPSLTFNGALTRSLTFGDSILELTGTGTVFDASGSGQILTAGTGTIKLTDASASARTVDGGSTSLDLPILWVSAGSGSMTTANCNVAEFNCTGFTGNWENNAIKSRGNITLPAGMTASAAVSAATRITAAGIGTINIGFTFDRAIYVGTSAWVLGANLVLGSSRAIYVDSATGGSFDDAGFTLTSGGAGAFGSGAASWTQRANYTMQTTGTAWSMPSTMTYTNVSGSITYTNSSATSKTFAGGGKTYGELAFTPGAGSGSFTITGSNTFATLSDTGTVAHTIYFEAGSTQTITTVWQVVGTLGQLISLDSVGGAAAHYLVNSTGATVTGSYLSISHSHVSGANSWFADGTCVDVVDNEGWFVVYVAWTGSSEGTSGAFWAMVQTRSLLGPEPETTKEDQMSILRNVALLTSAARVTSDQSTAVDSRGGNYGAFFQGYARTAAFYLTATAKTGTSPTLDVTIEDSEDGVNFTTVGAFTQLNDAIGSERKQFDGPFRKYIRVRWVIGGAATPGYTFKVDAVFQE